MDMGNSPTPNVHTHQHPSQWSMPAISLLFGPKDLVKTAIAFTRIHQSTYRFEILTLLIKYS